METATLFGASYSVYTRIAQLVMQEADLPYDLVEIDVFSEEGPPAGFAERHPFGKIPAFEHEGLRLFETDAIAQYVVGTCGCGDFLPPDPRERSRVIQIMRIMDNYGYPFLVWGIYAEEVEHGRPVEPGAVARARNVLAVIDSLAGRPFIAGANLTLADLWAVPMFAYLRLAPTGTQLLGGFPSLHTWLQRILQRPSLAATQYPAEAKTGSI